MSGRFLKLNAGRYTLSVPRGSGPAGVHRSIGGDIAVDRDGGDVAFDVSAEERVYFWWRGPSEPAGLRVLGPGPASRARPRTRRKERAERVERGAERAERGAEMAERGTQLAP